MSSKRYRCNALRRIMPMMGFMLPQNIVQ